MSEKIKSSDIFEGDIFKIVVDSAELAKTKIAELNKELVEVGTSFKKELNGIKADNVKEIEALIVKVKELTKAVDAQTQVNKANEIAMREAKKTSEQALREEEKTKREALKTQEQINKSNERAVKNQKDLSDAYKQLAQNTRDLKNESKRLGAEMLELEKQGKKNSAEYYKLSRQYKETTKSAIEGDKALKKLDSTVGDNFRNVGNYQKAIGGLKNALMQLGFAFGVFDGIKWLFDTQVNLDSLNLALKNVSGSAVEYGENLEFLQRISKSYGQDILVLMDTYKGFIASTQSSNLSLFERKRIYESVIKAGSALALSNDNIKGSLLAISQMFSKGTVSAEELRQQLGDRLPGAFGIMADSMGVTEAELGKLMKEGKVLADEVMPAFATELEIAFGSKANARLRTIGGAFNVLKTEVISYFDNVQKGTSFNENLARVLLLISRNIKPIISFLGTLLQIWISYNAVIKVSLLYNDLMSSSFVKGIKNGKGFAGILDSIKNSALGLGNVLKSNIVGILALFVAEFAMTASKLSSIRDKINTYKDELKQNKTSVDLTFKQEKIEVDALFKSLKNTNYESQRRSEIIDELNSKYGVTIKNLKDEKLFTDELNKAYLNINETLDEKLKKDKARIAYETTQRQLAEAKLTMDIAGAELDAFNKKSKLAQVGINLLEYAGSKGSNELISTYQATLDVYNSIKKLSDSAEKDYKKVLTIPTREGKKKNWNSDAPSKDILQNTKELRDLNLEYNQTNIYLSRQLEILKDIEEVKAKGKLQEAIDKTANILQQEEKNVNMTGKYNAGAVQMAIELEYQAKKEHEIKAFEKLKEDKNILIQKEFDEELDSIREQEQKKNKELLEMKTDYERRQSDWLANKKKANLSKESKQRWVEQGNLLTLENKAIKERAKIIVDGADEQEKIVHENRRKRLKDANLEMKGLTKKHEDELADIKRDAQDKTQDELDKLELIRAEKRLEMIKNTAESVNALIQKSLEHYINMAERRIDMIDKRMDRMSTQADFLREKAVAGNIQAQESLAVIDRQEIEAQKERMNEQRSIQKLQMAMAVFQAYSNNIQNAKVGENPFTKTLTDVTLLSQFINSLPTFIDGTETNIASALGKPQLQGQDGYLVRVDGSEKVLNPQLSAMTGNMTTMEIAKLAEDFRRGDIMRKGDGAMQLNVGSWGTDMIISELQDLKNVIKNKPENQVEVAEILSGVMHIVETKKSGNTKVRNISRFS